MTATASSSMSVPAGGSWTLIATGKANAYLQVRTGRIKVCLAATKPADGSDPGSFLLSAGPQVYKFENLDTATNIYAEAIASAATIILATPASVSGGGGTVFVSNFPGTQPVSGTVDVSNFPSSFAVSNFPGSFAVSNFPATQAISAASLPLPAGAATAANQPALNGDGGALAHVTNFPSTQAVTGTFWQTTQPVSAASLPLPAGAATAALQPALNGDGGALAHVTNFPATQNVALASLPANAGGTLTTNANSTGNQLVAPVNGRSAVLFQVANLTGSGATMTVEATADLTQTVWTAINAVNVLTGAKVATLTTDQTLRVDGAGWAYVRLRVSTSGSNQTITAYVGVAYPTGVVSLGSSLPDGANLIGNVGGAAAVGSAVSGNPIRTGAKISRASPSTSPGSDGNVGDVAVTVTGAIIDKPYAPAEADWQYTNASITSTTPTIVKAAGGANVRNYVTALTVQNLNSTATIWYILDGGSIIWQVSLPASMTLPVTFQFLTPLRGSANTDMKVAPASGSVSVMVNVQGFQAN